MRVLALLIVVVALVPAASWKPHAAAGYLDTRLVAWTHGGAMDHRTFCISCHTGLPFALGRSALRHSLAEDKPSAAERQMLASIQKRVEIWDQVQPYLGDKNSGLSTESVLNALILAAEDARTGHLTPTTKKALQLMWSYQSKVGDWPWINAGNEPWEAPDSHYWGVTLAALAVAEAPDGYAFQPQIQSGVKSLKTYLATQAKDLSLFNRLSLLLADVKLHGLLTDAERRKIVADALSAQKGDGGWSTSELIPADWKRHDGTPQSTQSDGYATGFVAFTLLQCGVSKKDARLQNAKKWLVVNQDPVAGSWPTVSPNAKRDPATDVGKFMTDAATAYASLALSEMPG